MPSRLALGLCLAALISAGATEAGALTVRAAIASTMLGAIIFASGGVAWSIPLLVFFLTSSLLSRIGRNASSLSARNDSPRRTARQVLANGSMPGLWAVCHFVIPGNACPVLFASALATAAADTWATEIGRRSSAPPRDVLTGQRVPSGTSGGVTVAGLVASFGGSSTVMGACLVTGVIGMDRAVAVAVAGFGGAVIDSLLGASLQERRWCPTCMERSEDAIHARCSAPTAYLSGVRGFDNDWVNLSAGACGSVLGVALGFLL